jgi:hypothetical protein
MNTNANLEWFYIADNQSFGPIDEQTVLSLIETHQLNKESMLWNRAFSSWVKAKDTCFNEAFYRQSPEIIFLPQGIYPPVPNIFKNRLIKAAS